MVADQEDDLIDTRFVRTPDGVDCVVPLHVYYWNCLDQMKAEGFTDLDEVVGIAWRGRARDAENGVHYSFQEALLVAINEMFEHYLDRIFGHAND